MSSKFDSRQRNTTDEEEGIDYFLLHNHTSAQIQQILKTRNLGEREIEETLDKISEARARIRKAVKKFLHVVGEHYPDISQDRLIAKGMKYANKYGLSDMEKRVFRVQIIKGYSDDYLENEELRTSDMSKFLGNDGSREYMLRLQPKEHAKLNELNSLYEETRQLYHDMRNQSLFYKDCDSTVTNAKFDNTKHNKHTHIHPLIFALFTPNVYYLNKRMLYTNFARMILSRGQAYLKAPISYMSGGSQIAEITADFELAHDISYDPNSLAYTPNESPLENLAKRFRIQIELWRNVLNLRNGKLYSTDYDTNDGITGFMRLLNTYEWSFFDSPEFYNMADEGALLRKLLAVFACRPTFSRLMDVGYNFPGSLSPNIAKQSYINLPMVNVRLPIVQPQQPLGIAPQYLVNLQNTIQTPSNDTYIVHKRIVQKSRQIVFSRDVLFFYANRKYPEFNIAGYDIKMKLLNMPPPFYTNLQELNENSIVVPFKIENPHKSTAIANDHFLLRSAVFIIKPKTQQQSLNIEDKFSVPLQTGAFVYKYQSGVVYPSTTPAIPSDSYRYDPLMINEIEPITYGGQKTAISLMQYKPVAKIATTSGVTPEVSHRGVLYFYCNSKV